MSVRNLLPEVGLMGGGLVATTIVMAVLGRSASAALVVTARYGAFAAIVTLAILPAMLAAQPPVVDEDEYRLFRMAVPDRRDFPLAVLAGLPVSC
ncbi:MAG: hypothetical protein R2706_02565 [Acidimicrobiales bacterium]